jgi:phage baseplate assembly protein W
MPINFPYTVDASGVVGATTNPAKVYLDRVLTLLSTTVGQRPMLPTYGVDWSTSLFENDNKAQPAITGAIQTAVAKWLPEISVTSVTFDSNKADGVENVTVGLKLPDNTITSITLNTEVLNYYGTIAG